VVQCNSTECLEIVYFIPYNWDTGRYGFGAHRGDGEMYSVLVTRTDPVKSHGYVPLPSRWDTPWEIAKNHPSAWVGYQELGTAHTCTSFDSTSYRQRTFKPDVDGPTLVYVSQAKHGNYFSWAACDAGASGFDSCPDVGTTLNYAVLYGQTGGPLRNAGELECHSHPSFDHINLYPGGSPDDAPYGSYDVWSSQPFGDDNLGKPLSLLRPGTITWWPENIGHVTCW
jgi:hypothetical protein